MALDAKIMAAAYRRQQQDRESRRRDLERREQEVYSRVPRVAQIDRELRGTAAKIVLAAFETDGDPEAALLQMRNVNLALQRERAELLVGHGWPLDYLDGAPQCPQCQDSGYLRDGTPCRCLNAYYTQEQNRRLSKLLDLGGQSFETFSFEWYSPNGWPEYGRSPLDNMRMVRAICEEYAQTFGPYSGNLLFTGAPGLGKTFLSACIARRVSERGFSVVYDTANHVFQQFESSKFGHENPYEEDPDREINRYLNCDLLIMDDLGTELMSNFIQSVFYRIINDRLLSRRETVLSTNLTVDGLGDRYGEAVRSRIRGEYQVLVFFGDDIRVLKRDRS
ncbi:MAG: ATP-binding protein [Oscillospiraceae bacterium]|nr:ATP-binding protein [Oscillospiraceae bacterium]